MTQLELFKKLHSILSYHGYFCDSWWTDSLASEAQEILYELEKIGIMFVTKYEKGKICEHFTDMDYK